MNCVFCYLSFLELVIYGLADSIFMISLKLFLLEDSASIFWGGDVKSMDLLKSLLGD